MNRLSIALRTTAVRLSALYLALFTVSAVVLVVYVTALFSSISNHQTRLLVEEELKVLGSFYRRGGITLLVSHVDRRSRQPGANLYTIAGSDGKVVGGNVSKLAGRYSRHRRLDGKAVPIPPFLSTGGHAKPHGLGRSDFFFQTACDCWSDATWESRRSFANWFAGH